MESSYSFLFSGTHFDRKKFASDFAIFERKKEIDKVAEVSSFVEDEEPKVQNDEEEEEEEEEEERVRVKKRKRKTASASNSETAGGISVFKRSKSAKKSKEEEKDKPENRTSLEKKKFYKQLERDAIFRKQYNIHVSGSNIPSPLKDFAELSSRYGCKPKLLRNLVELGFKEPTPIQRQAIPLLLSGRECFACAPTGSGKTLAFVCPILMKLKYPSKDAIRAVILLPTRELATQTLRECKKFAEGSKFRIKLLTKQLVKGADLSKFVCDVLISTPLRLKLAAKKKKLKLSKVEYLVLDESDKLFELGLIKQIDTVVKACSNPSIVRSLFSATLPDSVEQLARTTMHDAVRVIIGRKNTACENVEQKLVFAGSEDGKLVALRQSFAESLNPPVLIFVQSKERAKELYGELLSDDIRVDVIHSDLSQVHRDNAIDNFRAGKTWVLIATDVIARGMDFKAVNCVINYDFPDSTSAYIHRIGRSGRAGRTGQAITLYTEDDIPFLRNIANEMKSSGSGFPSWLLGLRKNKWRKHRPQRDSISTTPD